MLEGKKNEVVFLDDGEKNPTDFFSLRVIVFRAGFPGIRLLQRFSNVASLGSFYGILFALCEFAALANAFPVFNSQ